ncbi:hypothetical protein JTB14_023066 [Gonioctena quinquepunctata]|nr:hypothetical protein JTB14_023066 [Gonioctena quinquepunctata]
MRPGAKKSIVWEHFDKIGDNQVQCRTFKKILKFLVILPNLTNILSASTQHFHPFQYKSVGEEHSNEHEQATIPTNQSPGPSSAAGGSGDSKLVTGWNNNLSFPPKRQRQMKLVATPSDDLKESDIEKIDNALMKIISKDYQPLSLVEDGSFIEFTSLLQPNYELPNRKKLFMNFCRRFTPRKFQC